VVALACLGSQCDGSALFYDLEQYHFGENEPWRRLADFNDICRERICEQADIGGSCTGTTDGFLIRNFDEDSARDRYMFFEQTGEFFNEWSPFFDPTRWFRSAGPYQYWEGPGESGLHYPIGRNVEIGHVRHYRRGACSEAASIAGLKDEVANKIIEKAEDSWAIVEVETIKKLMHVYLGSEDCTGFMEPQRDFVHLGYAFRVYPLSAGSWTLYASFYFRLVSGTRTRYLVCEKKDCPEYVACIDDAECHALMPGAHCDVFDGVCRKDNALDVADYGASFEYSNGCHPWEFFCNKYFQEFKKAFAEIEANIYRDFYVSLVAGIYDQFYQDPGFDVSCDDGCRDWEDQNLEGRCVEIQREEQCEFRPMYVYRVNMYPNEAEFVLAPLNDRQEYPQVNILNLIGSCEEPTTPSWSGVSDEWVE
jgi:hypothetical protein